MAKLNTPHTAGRTALRTHEGAPAQRITPLQTLRRSVMACLLWEQTFYEDGKAIADRIAELVAQVDPLEVSKLALRARNSLYLRHVPLLLCRELARHGKLHGETLNGSNYTLTCEVRQGYVSEASPGTLIATLTSPAISGDTLQTDTYTLSAAEANAIKLV